MAEGYVNDARDRRAKHDGSGSGGSPAHGSGKVKSSAAGGESAGSPSFKSAESMLGLPDEGSIPVSGLEVSKGSPSVPGVALNEGSNMVGETAADRVGKLAGRK